MIKKIVKSFYFSTHYIHPQKLCFFINSVSNEISFCAGSLRFTWDVLKADSLRFFSKKCSRLRRPTSIKVSKVLPFANSPIIFILFIIYYYKLGIISILILINYSTTNRFFYQKIGKKCSSSFVFDLIF